jgi:hypothetical protein
MDSSLIDELRGELAAISTSSKRASAGAVRADGPPRDYFFDAFRAAQRAFMASDSFFLPAAVNPPRFCGLAVLVATAFSPLALAHRAR